MNIIQGVLEAFCETGTEGIIWSIYETSLDWIPITSGIMRDSIPQRSFDHLHTVEPGDCLVVFDKSKTVVAWKGIVKYDRTNFRQVIGSDESLSYSEWENFFFEELPAILIKQNEN